MTPTEPVTDHDFINGLPLQEGGCMATAVTSGGDLGLCGRSREEHDPEPPKWFAVEQLNPDWIAWTTRRGAPAPPPEDEARAWIDSLTQAEQEAIMGDGLCAMPDCGKAMSSVIRFDAVDNKRVAVRVCSEHYEFLIAQVSKTVGLRYLVESPPKGRGRHADADGVTRIGNA